jgi:hypothetical protein
VGLAVKDMEPIHSGLEIKSTHLTTAKTMYREMGMTYWLEQAVVIVDGL